MPEVRGLAEQKARPGAPEPARRQARLASPVRGWARQPARAARPFAPGRARETPQPPSARRAIPWMRGHSFRCWLLLCATRFFRLIGGQLIVGAVIDRGARFLERLFRVSGLLQSLRSALQARPALADEALIFARGVFVDLPEQVAAHVRLATPCRADRRRSDRCRRTCSTAQGGQPS